MSASVLCPAFVADTGIYSEMQQRHGARPSPLFRPVPVSDVAAAALRAVHFDLPDVIVAPGPMRAAVAMAMLAPRLGESVGHFIGSHNVFAQVAKDRT